MAGYATGVVLAPLFPLVLCVFAMYLRGRRRQLNEPSDVRFENMPALIVGSRLRLRSNHLTADSPG